MLLDEVNLVCSIIGVFLGGAALWIAIVQIGRARSAAEAARFASEKTLNQVSHLASVVDLRKLCGRANEVLVLIKHENYGGAATRAQDLRVELAAARKSKWGSFVLPDEHAWQQMITHVAQLYEGLFEATRDSPPDKDTRKKWVRRIGKVHEDLNAMAATATDRIGA